MGVQALRSKRLILLHEKRVRRTTKMKIPPPSVPRPEALDESTQELRSQEVWARKSPGLGTSRKGSIGEHLT